MRTSQNKLRYFSKPGTQSERAAVGCLVALATHPGSFNAAFECSTASGFLSIKNSNRRRFPRMLCDVACIRFDLVMMQLLLQEMVMSFLTNLTEMN